MSDTPHTPDDSSPTDSPAIDPSNDSAPAESNETPEHVTQDCAKAPLNKKWSIKLFLITFFVIGFGAYGLYDATIAYPNRGQRFADWAKMQYLEAAKAASSEEFGYFERNTSIADPVATLEELSDPTRRQQNLNDAQNQSSSSRLRSTARNARYDWLKGLKTIGELKPENTIIEFPNDELTELKTRWSSTSSIPKPLKGYDIPSQWAIMVVCWVIGFWMLVNIIKVVRQKYSWEADSMTLTVPGPIAITPAHLEEVDKRKWDKFIVFLKLNNTHPSHGGKEIKVDTYQHALVEDWILAMEVRAFGSQEDGE
ncbi:MAG: hypothetical protein JJ974_01330 [Phycisphaerales bacterium]|nr:hypothetical protein [Phycisphaerales bacterium]